MCGASLWGNAQHVLMPAIALGIGRAAILTRLLRASMLEVIRTEYVTTARAKGLAERPVVLKHALKNALIPTVTVMGLQVGFLIGGAIVVETLFAMPGLGTFGIDAIIARDYQQVQGFALLTALAFVVMNLARGPHLHVPGSAHPVRLRRPWPTTATRSRAAAPIRGGSVGEADLPADRRRRVGRARRAVGIAAGAGAPPAAAQRRPRWSARRSSWSCSSSRSSPTCWRPGARSPTTRRTPSSARAGTIPLGTDQLGRDMLCRIIHGTRISLLVGVSSVLLALFVGVPFG